MVTLTDAGLALRDKAVTIPAQVGGCVRLSPEDARALYGILYRLLGSME